MASNGSSRILSAVSRAVLAVVEAVKDPPGAFEAFVSAINYEARSYCQVRSSLTWRGVAHLLLVSLE